MSVAVIVEGRSGCAAITLTPPRGSDSRLLGTLQRGRDIDSLEMT